MHLLNELDLRTNMPHRWRKAQLLASTRLVPPLPGMRRYCVGAACGVKYRRSFPAGRSQVGEIPVARPAPVSGRLLPQALGRGPAAVAGCPSHDAPTFALDDQPEPHFVIYGAPKRPYRVQLQRRPPVSSTLHWAAGAASRGKLSGLFFSRPAIVRRETPVARTMLRGGLRPASSWSACACCAALATGTNRAW